jgi:pimeloyl-ACP methyl ester carboxylesterase
MVDSEAGAAAVPPLGARWDVSDGAMLLHQSGAGGVPVVWLAGGGMFGLYYWNVHELVAEFATSVIYDRLGMGWSDAVELPRSSTRVIEDLHELLSAAGVRAPYVLVGHSLGGLYARHFAKRFPDEVAGLVLLDPTHEDIAEYLPEQAAQRLSAWTSDVVLPPEQVEAMRSLYRSVFGRALADWPDSIREPLLEQGFSGEVYARSLREPMNLPELFDEVRAAGADPDVPLVVLSAMGSDAFADELLTPEIRESAAESGRAKHRCYEDHVASMPRAELRRIDDAGHSGLAWARSDAVVGAIRDVLPR